MTAEAMKIARQDPSGAMKLETGRAPMTQDKSGRLGREPERLGDRFDQRLGVIDVGGEQQDRRGRDLRLGRGRRPVQPIHP